MKDFVVNKEILSQYIDNELSNEEKKLVEEKLLESAELRNELEELKRLKSSIKNSHKPLPEDPYFENKLMSSLTENKKGFSFKRYSPAFVFGAIAIIIAVVVKANPNLFESLIKEQSRNIASFYTDNLKPLLYSTSLSSDEIFDFAFYGKLPLDESNRQFLMLGYNNSGKEFFEIQTAEYMPETGTLTEFATALKLNEKEKAKVDSILRSYEDDIQMQVLVNDKNTLAINPNLWNYNKAIAADVFKYAISIRKDQLAKAIPSAYNVYADNDVNIVQAINKVKDYDENDFIFFTPDSIFHYEYHIDKDEIKRELARAKAEHKKAMKEMEKIKDLKINLKLDSNLVILKKHRFPHDKDFKINFDSNSCRVEIYNFEIPEFDLPDIDSLNKHIEKEMKNFKSFSFSMPDAKSFKFKMNDSTFIVDMPNVDSMMSESMKHMDKMKIDIDSLNNMKFYYNGDSTNAMNFDFKFEMKEFKEEMKKFREDMERFRRELKKEKKHIKEPTEI